jgi:phosphatidylserine/phosphatidylglycerophosphate/cardiolipin synthase-like enzyme
VNIILSKKWFESYLTKWLESYLKKWLVSALTVKEFSWSAKMHAKAVMVDKKYLYIWSSNFSTSSVDSNREMWLIFTNSDLIKKFLKVFGRDWK